MNPPISDRKTATILAALRYWQREGVMSAGIEQDIASDHGRITPLSASEIDALCRRERGYEESPVNYRVVLTVTIDPNTTRLTSAEHKQAVIEGLFAAIGNGLLTAHEPEAEVDSYKIDGLESLMVWMLSHASSTVEIDAFSGQVNCNDGDPATQPALLRPVCPECGSTNVVADTAARWNTETQEWEVSNVFDKGHSCDDCEAEDIEFKWVALSEVTL